MQTSIGDALARKLLSGEVRDGQTVVVDAKPDLSGLVVGPATDGFAADAPAAVTAGA